MINVECSDDVLVVGYPMGFFDAQNIFPIVKRGIVASGWGLKWNGEPFFLVDVKLFPGSSGSVVLTKPVDHLLIGGKIHHSPGGKQYAVLGIYSGEPYVGEGDSEETIDVGIVWYASLLPEIISGKVRWSSSIKPSVSISSLVRPTRRKLVAN